MKNRSAIINNVMFQCNSRDQPFPSSLKGFYISEQPLWEMINGSWYAFGADSYAKSGFVFDPALNGFFYVDINSGMKTGGGSKSMRHGIISMKSPTGQEEKCLQMPGKTDTM